MKIEELKWNADGLIPVVAQDYRSGEVLMLAWANQEAVEKTLETGRVHYFSRSRQSLWQKGETSGNIQILKKLYYDCDADALLVSVRQEGPACHTGNKTCFYRTLDAEGENGGKQDGFSNDMLKTVLQVIQDRKVRPKEGSYTNYLFDKGIDKILKKVGEETAEVIIAAKNPDPGELIYEVADLMYHVSVLLAEKKLDWDDIYNELKNRR